jgi:hypothetical protein
LFEAKLFAVIVLSGGDLQLKYYASIAAAILSSMGVNLLKYKLSPKLVAELQTMHTMHTQGTEV